MSSFDLIKESIPKGASTVTTGNVLSFEIPESELLKLCANWYHEKKWRLESIVTCDERSTKKSFTVRYIFRIPKEHEFVVPYIVVNESLLSFPSLTPIIHEASLYEREIKTFFGLQPVGHPNPQMLILHNNWPDDIFPLRKDFVWNDKTVHGSSSYTFDTYNGEGVYEIPVGPVHAGVIEPGHFRFSVIGEEILLLDPRLGYKHKGIEKLFEQLPMKQKLELSERVSGDSSFHHSLAFCQALETLSDTVIPQRASYLRVVYSELERLANHFNDIGFIMLDTAFNFGGSQCARLREMIMQCNERLTQSRFLRGVNTFGGVTRDIDMKTASELLADLKIIEKDFREVMEVAQKSLSLLNRLKDTGNLDPCVANDHGVRGVPLRALGVPYDIRREYPYAAYGELNFDVVTSSAGGDVYSRFMVRVSEVFQSFKLISSAIEQMPNGEICSHENLKLQKNSCGVGMTEGWRGDILYFVATDESGEISRVQVRDTSYLNWTAFPYAVSGNVIPDFPLINKSFNLSYSGFDR